MKIRDFIYHIKHNSVILTLYDLDNDEIIVSCSIGESKHNINLLRYYDYDINYIKCYVNEFLVCIRGVKDEL